MMACMKEYMLTFILLIVAYLKICVLGDPQVPCYFIFGDSLVDSGNNNNLATLAKVDYLPYGIDFPDGPTGRFTNGRTTADIIGKLLGFEHFIPSFLAASGSEILEGVNYASGSAGIRDETGKQLGVNIELNKQLQNHQVIISRIIDMLGNDSAIDHLNQCLYSFVIGSNDYLNNYFVPNYYNTSKQYNPEQYAQVLINQYSQRIKTLYSSGARLVALTGIGPIGCTPHAIESYDRNGSLCVDYMNEAVNHFNNQLESVVDQLNQELVDAKFIYLNTYGILSSEYPASPDFQIKISGCCKVNEYGQCIPGEDPCLLRDLYVFWDSFHPSEAANKIGGLKSYLALRKILKSFGKIHHVTNK